MYQSWPLAFWDRMWSPRFLIDRHGGRFRKYGHRVDLFHCLLKQSTAHSDPEDDHPGGESLMMKKETNGSVSGGHCYALLTNVSTRGMSRDENYIECVPNISKRGPL
jgi:hypothetical protein